MQRRSARQRADRCPDTASREANRHLTAPQRRRKARDWRQACQSPQPRSRGRVGQVEPRTRRHRPCSRQSRRRSAGATSRWAAWCPRRTPAPARPARLRRPTTPVPESTRADLPEPRAPRRNGARCVPRHAGELADVEVESLVPEDLAAVPVNEFLERLEELDTLWDARVRAAAERVRAGARLVEAEDQCRHHRPPIRVEWAMSWGSATRAPKLVHHCCSFRLHTAKGRIRSRPAD